MKRRKKPKPQTQLAKDLAPDVQYWIDLSAYDLETAHAMLKSRRYLYVLFMCQQAIEKFLKGLVVHRAKQFPPRTHDLPRLLKFASVKLRDDVVDFLKQLTRYYIETRYPEDVRKLMKTVNRKLALEFYERTKELCQELSTKLS